MKRALITAGVFFIMTLVTVAQESSVSNRSESRSYGDRRVLTIMKDNVNQDESRHTQKSKALPPSLSPNQVGTSSSKSTAQQMAPPKGDQKTQQLTPPPPNQVRGNTKKLNQVGASPSKSTAQQMAPQKEDQKTQQLTPPPPDQVRGNIKKLNEKNSLTPPPPQRIPGSNKEVPAKTLPAKVLPVKAATPTKATTKSPQAKRKKLIKNIYAVMKVTGLPDNKVKTIKIKLFYKQTPKTVENFIGLAEGTIKTPRRSQDQRKNRKDKGDELIAQQFYNGLTFHRVIPGFMIQGGCPLGTGQGGPGYQFEDEPVCSLRHNKAGLLSMANRGPNTNGSQFFITLGPANHLDLMTKNCQKKRGSGHTIFGEVVEGLDIVKAIGSVKRDRADKPLTDIHIQSVEIVRE